jgi:TonB family protein
VKSRSAERMRGYIATEGRSGGYLRHFSGRLNGRRLMRRGARLTMRRNGLISRVLLWAVMLVPAFAAAQQDSSEMTRKVTSRVVPAYPELARAMNVKGSVRLQVVVAPNGTAKSVKVIGGHPVLAQAAERAVQKWKWERVAHDTSEPIELRFNPQENSRAHTGTFCYSSITYRTDLAMIVKNATRFSHRFF